MEKKILKIENDCMITERLKDEGFSFGQIMNMLKRKDVRLNGEKVKDDCFVCAGDELTIFYEAIKKPTERKFEVVFEDENIIIINKPFGIEIEGDGLAKVFHALPVHRLDRNTTGLTILAKNSKAQNCLFDAFKNRGITKKYYAEVVGQADFKNFRFDAYLVKDSKESKVKIFTKPLPNSQAISTTFNTIKSSSFSSLIECTLHTGKTHQIRASLAFLKHPIIGDGKYGKNEDNKRFKENKQRLHAFFIMFNSLTTPLEYLNGKTFKSLPNWVKS